MKTFEHYLNITQNKTKRSQNMLKTNELRNVSVTYSDGTVIDTDMAAHLTDEQIRDYFKVGKKFNLGNASIPCDGNIGDNIQTVTVVTINETSDTKLYSSTKNYLDITVGDKVFTILGPHAGKNKFYGIVDIVLPTELYITFYDIITNKKVSGSVQMVYDYIHKSNNTNINESSLPLNLLNTVAMDFTTFLKHAGGQIEISGDKVFKQFKNLGTRGRDYDEHEAGYEQTEDNKVWIPGEYTKYERMFKDWAQQYPWVTNVKLSLSTSEKNLCEFKITERNRGMRPANKINESYGMMAVVIPRVEEWYNINVISMSPITDTVVNGFKYMGKEYAIRPKNMELFKANTGKLVKFKYDKNTIVKFMDFPVITN